MSVTTDFQAIAPLLAMQPAELEQYKLTLLDQITAGQFDDASPASIGHVLPFMHSMILWQDRKTVPQTFDELATQRAVRMGKALLRLWQRHPDQTTQLLTGILASPRIGSNGLDLLIYQNAKQPYAAELMHRLATTADHCATNQPAGSPLQLAALALAAEVVPHLPAQKCQWFAHYVEVPCAEDDPKCLITKLRLARKLVEKDTDYYPQAHQLVMDCLQPNHSSEIWYEALHLARLCLSTPSLAAQYGTAYYQRIGAALTLYESNEEYEHKAITPLMPAVAAALPEHALPLWQMLESKLQEGVSDAPHNKRIWDLCGVMHQLEAQNETVAAYAKDQNRLIAKLQSALPPRSAFNRGLAYGEGCD